MKPTRPANLPPELPDPPNPPDGMVWEYRGRNWTKGSMARYAFFWGTKWTDSGKLSYPLGRAAHYVEAVPITPEPTTTMKPYYYVYRVGFAKPTVKHASLESAATESMRLAGQHPGETFEILMCLGITRTASPQTFWMDGVESEPPTE